MYRPHPHLVPDPGPRYAVKRHRTSPVTYGESVTLVTYAAVDQGPRYAVGRPRTSPMTCVTDGRA